MSKFRKTASVFALLLVSIFMLSACDAQTLFQEFYDIMFTDTTQDDTDTGDIGGVFNDTVVENLAISGTQITWDAVAEETEETEYVVAYYSNSVEPTTEVVDTNAFSLDTLLATNNEIFGVRVGVQNESGQNELTSPVYYNPQSFSPYTNEIYYFDGELFDYYIQSQEEFNLFAHYSFIYRLQSVDLKFEEAFYETISDMSDVMYEAYNESFLETISLSYGYTVVSAEEEVVRLTLNYNNAIEPTLTLDPTYIQDDYALPYYETVSYTPRAEDFDDFATDHKVITANVSTGEELFWAVDSGATPVFADTTNNGYRLYQKAKDVLREIISDDMTDEEKLMSIFDYIATNTVYDYEIIASDFRAYHTEPYMSFGSFYLEGVLDDGLAVCDGFSKAFSLLANMEGIETVRIVGYASGGGHAWNKVKLNDAWYVVDITWTELTDNDYATGEATEYLSRRYFLVSDNEIASTHTPFEGQEAKDHDAPTNYYFYANQTFVYNGTSYSYVIDTTTKASALINYLWQNFQNNTGVTSMDVVISQSILDNWGTIVRGVKNSYNVIHEDRFDNDVLRITENYMLPYSTTSSGYSSVVQIHDTFYNLAQQD